MEHDSEQRENQNNSQQPGSPVRADRTDLGGNCIAQQE